MKIKMSLAAIAAVAVIGVAGCSMPEEPESYSEQGKTMQEAKPTKKTEKKAEAAAPKWVGHMDEVTMGMSQAEVKAILGKPDDTTASESEFMGETTTLDMWTYGDILSDADGDDLWSLSFTDGKLDGKTRM